MREDVVVWCLVSLGCVVRGRSEGGMRWFLWGKLLKEKGFGWFMVWGVLFRKGRVVLVYGV